MKAVKDLSESTRQCDKRSASTSCLLSEITSHLIPMSFNKENETKQKTQTQSEIESVEEKGKDTFLGPRLWYRICPKAELTRHS